MKHRNSVPKTATMLVLEKSILVHIPAIGMSMIFSPENLVVSHEYGIVSFGKTGDILSSTIGPKESIELRDVGFSYIDQETSDKIESHMRRMEREFMLEKIRALSEELRKLRTEISK